MEISVLSAPQPAPDDQQDWGGLQPAAAALAIASVARERNSLIVVVTQDTTTAERYEDALRFFLDERSDRRVLRLPDWETLPYDRFSPHQDLISDRLLALYQLSQGVVSVLVVPAATLMQRLAPLAYVGASTLALERGQRLQVDALRRTLEQAGYRNVDTVFEHGEFALRGSIVDIFPMGSSTPVRIELFDDEIETLRSFDPESQRTLTQLEHLRLLPGREFPFHEEAIAAFRRRWHERFDNDHRLCPDYQDIARGIAPGGIEYYLPLFFDECATLFDYLPPESALFVEEGLRDHLGSVWHSLDERYESLRSDITRPVLKPVEICMPPDELMREIKRFSRVRTSAARKPERAGTCNFDSLPLPDLAGDARFDDPLKRIREFAATPGQRLLLCAESPGRRELLNELLLRADLSAAPVNGWSEFCASPARLAIGIAPLQEGFQLTQTGISLVPEAALFGRRVLQRRRRGRAGESYESAIRNLSELSPGAPVVHIEHGVGRYLGLEVLDVAGERAEFLCIEYADEAKLYVPVAALDTVSRYTGVDSEHVPLHRLGSDQWQKARRRAAERIRDVAAELLEIYARRESRPGVAFTHPGAAYESFAASFPFEETPDQLSAIEAVIEDMCAPRSMDRLVCGDVGFGKTEVAMRAAFVAVHNGRQVAVLVPTTLLAQQHFDTFSDRFAELPVSIEALSRFKSAAEQKAILQRVAEGKVDILIGTHSLLQSNVKYRDLGLLVIDEEHRFGVRQKEQLKALRASVDILTLTATPIPRTLNMAVAGLRDLSIISTPPARRLAVKTFVQRYDAGVIKDAMNRELRRGGQVFFLHNDVKTIARRASEIGGMLAECRVGVAHGQMRERELERVMSDFYHKRFNVLCCTTIIETGIDIPSANTIIIERSDKFGLAQLHQLRGRVGRSHHQAYAFLLTPDERAMTPDAIKRLEAIAETESLGAGFLLATHDLEIRGAGELLGEEQSGQIQAIGYSLYMELLARAVDAIRAGRVPDADSAFKATLEVNLRIPALIPDDYLPDVHNRLIMYKRIASASSQEELRGLEVEMIDRFGLLPAPAKNLFRCAHLRVHAAAVGVSKIEASPSGGVIEFAPQTNVDPLTIVRLVQQDPRHYRLDGGSRLRFMESLPENEGRLAYVEKLVSRLAAPGDAGSA